MGSGNRVLTFSLTVMEERFYYCQTCGNLMFATIASGVTPYCCGDEMTLLKANEVEGNAEKHLPVVTRVGENMYQIVVGATLHPMTKEHSIRFIAVETTNCVIIRYLGQNELPDVTLDCNGTPRAVYAYCNLHGLWRTPVSVS